MTKYASLCQSVWGGRGQWKTKLPPTFGTTPPTSPPSLVQQGNSISQSKTAGVDKDMDLPCSVPRTNFTSTTLSPNGSATRNGWLNKGGPAIPHGDWSDTSISALQQPEHTDAAMTFKASPVGTTNSGPTRKVRVQPNTSLSAPNPQAPASLDRQPG